MRVNKKSLVIAIACNILWGVLPPFWHLLADVDPLVVLCCRFVASLAVTLCILAISGRMQTFRDTLKSPSAMRCLVPAAFIVTLNWGIYIWAVNAGHILDCSIGYYMNPLMGFALGVLIFREKCTKLQLAAVALAVIGVAISVIAFGTFPFISVILALTFAMYGLFKKKAHADPVAGIAAETLVITPFALAFLFIFKMDSIRAASLVDLLLLVGTGVVTAIPLFLYARSVNDIPFVIVSFLFYLCPILIMIYGIISGEVMSTSQLISFIFIGLGLIVFSIALVKNTKTENAA